MSTLVANFPTVAAYISGNIVPAFVANTVMKGLITSENLQSGTLAHKFPVYGSLSASSVAEGAQASVVDLTDASVTVTAAKVKVFTKRSEEAELVIGSQALDRLTYESGTAIARKFDTDAVTLFTGLSTVAGATGQAMSDVYLEAAIYAHRAANTQGTLVGVLHPRQIGHLGAAFRANGAVGWNTIAQNGLQNGQPIPSGFAGNAYGIDFYSSTLVTNDGTDYSGAIFSRYALGAVFGNNGNVNVMITEDPEYGLYPLSMSMLYGIAEIKDAAGVKILTKVAA